MERLVATYRVGIHEIDVLETIDDDSVWYRVIVDGSPRDDVFSIPPTSADAAGLVTAGRPAGTARDEGNPP